MNTINLKTVIILLIITKVQSKLCDNQNYNILIDSNEWYGDMLLNIDQTYDHKINLNLIFEPREIGYESNYTSMIDIGSRNLINLKLIGSFDLDEETDNLDFSVDDIIFDDQYLCHDIVQENEDSVESKTDESEKIMTVYPSSTFNVVKETPEIVTTTPSTTVDPFGYIFDPVTPPKEMVLETLECGIVETKIQPFIYNGVDANHGDFPWHSAIYYYTSRTLSYSCGGSLISDDFVITAAHCATQSGTDVPLRGERIVIFFGKDQLHSFNEFEQNSRVSNVFIHPSYQTRRFKADLALLKLKTPPQFTTYVNPVCLWNFAPDLDKIVGENGLVIDNFINKFLNIQK